MTEIHVQPKKRSIWPWVAGLVAVLLVLWVLVDRDSDRDQFATGDVAPGYATPDAAPSTWTESERFILFVRNPAGTTTGAATGATAGATTDAIASAMTGEMEGTHRYTRTGLRYLASALAEVNRQGGSSSPNVAPTVEALRIGAEELNESASAPEHARAAAPVFRQAAEAITTLQRERHPNAASQASAVREAAEQVSPDRSLQAQREEVRTFFNRAVTALQAMGAPAPQTR